MNQCGECHECCTFYHINEIGKKAVQDCHFHMDGCIIEDSKPQVCKDYKCAYLEFGWEEDLRPDRCGVLVRNRRISGLEIQELRNNVESSILDRIREKKHDRSTST